VHIDSWCILIYCIINIKINFLDQNWSDVQFFFVNLWVFIIVFHFYLYSIKWCACICVYLIFSEATKITEGPSDTEALVGDSRVLQCSASYDPSLDITFIWTVDSYVINFYTDFEHYEQLMVSRGKNPKSSVDGKCRRTFIVCVCFCRVMSTVETCWSRIFRRGMQDTISAQLRL